jgi:hypothetical protein
MKKIKVSVILGSNGVQHFATSLRSFYSFIYVYIFALIFRVQIENEYEPETKAFGPAGYAYMTWAAKMAVGLDTGVPWVMCKEDDAPDPVVMKLNLHHEHETHLTPCIFL